MYYFVLHKMRRDDYFWKAKLSEEKQPIKHLPGKL